MLIFKTVKSWRKHEGRNTQSKITSVRWDGDALNSLKKWANAILASNNANLIPMQFLGPAPNGK